MKLQQSPSCQLFMTLSLARALQVLAMPQLELSQFLLEEIEKNPLLELDSLPPSPSYKEPVAPPSFHEHIMAQIREAFPNTSEQLEAISLFELLDDKGFLPNPPTSPLLPILKTFHPKGVFAKDLRECLLLQLDQSSPAYKIVKHCFKELLQKKFHLIQKKAKIEDLPSAIKALVKLHFRPKDLFSQDFNSPIIPDLFFSKMDQLQMLEDSLPKFHLRTDYLLLQDPLVTKWLTSAKWLIRTIKRRKNTLLKIGSFLIRKQKAFLEQTGPLKPLSLKELSQNLNLHESTLSRAIANKYVETPRGTLPLRSFLSNESANVKRALHALLQHETKPLTDKELVLELKKRGIQIARRTVAKYRKSCNIAPSSHRKFL